MIPSLPAALRVALPLSLAILATGCASTAKPGAAAATSASSAATALVAADAALVPIGFLAGTWTQAQPRGAMIEEHWMEPRGKSMLGSFRRILGNGATPFYEFTQIVAEPDGVHLRQIHVHGNFETDPRRKDAMHLKLDRSGAGMVSFVPIADAAAAHAGSLERVTYTLGDDGVLTVRVEERARATEPGKPAGEPQVLEFRMTRR
jgi:hypothetical protein